MTWAEWINSDYNDIGCYIYNAGESVAWDYVYSDGYVEAFSMYNENEEQMYGSDIIISDYIYQCHI
jgi:hypothetical protein